MNTDTQVYECCKPSDSADCITLFVLYNCKTCITVFKQFSAGDIQSRNLYKNLAQVDLHKKLFLYTFFFLYKILAPNTTQLYCMQAVILKAVRSRQEPSGAVRTPSGTVRNRENSIKKRTYCFTAIRQFTAVIKILLLWWKLLLVLYIFFSLTVLFYRCDTFYCCD